MSPITVIFFGELFACGSRSLVDNEDPLLLDTARESRCRASFFCGVVADNTLALKSSTSAVALYIVPVSQQYYELRDCFNLKLGRRARTGVPQDAKRGCLPRAPFCWCVTYFVVVDVGCDLLCCDVQ